MKSFRVILIIGIVFSVLGILFLLFFSGDTSSDKPQEDGYTLDTVTTQNNFGSDNTVTQQPRSLYDLFSTDLSIEMERFLSEYVNQEVYFIERCSSEPDIYKMTLVANAIEDSSGIMSFDATETYLYNNYPSIAPHILQSLLPGIDVGTVGALQYSVYDYDLQIYRGILSSQNGEIPLFHSWIGNDIVFSVSRSCLADSIIEFYESH